MEHLLLCFFDGTASEEEAREVNKWIQGEEANRKVAEQLRTLYLATDTAYALKNIDTERALKTVKKKMNRKTVPWWGWTQRVAAVLSIPLFICLLLMYTGNKRQPAIAQMIEIKTNPGMTTSIVLPDSTVVHLNSETSLRYPSVFYGTTRHVELTGEAFFDVAKDLDKSFIVTTPYHSHIEVFGTSFNVEAYERDKTVCTTLVKGSVGFTFKNEAGIFRSITLVPNQKVVYSPQTGQASIYSTSCRQETAWKEGKMIFDNTPMKELLHELSKRYNVDFIVKDLKLYENAFTGSFTTQRLERIMDFLKISSRINWRFIDNGQMTDEKQKIEIY